MSVKIIQRTLSITCWSNARGNVFRKFSSVSTFSPNKKFVAFKECPQLKIRFAGSLVHANFCSSSYVRCNVASERKPEKSTATRKQIFANKKPSFAETGTETRVWTVKAMTTAEEYNLERLLEDLISQQLYIPDKISTSTSSFPDVIHAVAKYETGSERREIYFFREGTVVMWNTSDLERNNILQFLKKYQENSYAEKIVELESESMSYSYAEHGKGSHLKDGNFVLGLNASTIDKYTFSNAMAQSVRLGILEATLNEYIHSIEFVSADLKAGKKIKLSQHEVLRKQGELFALRHSINLSSDLLDTPDFYWDRDDLERLYHQVCSYFNIAKRTRVINEKLNHCAELIGILSTHLSDRHHIRLEWMIIVLIMVEVVFEVLHYIDRYFA